MDLLKKIALAASMLAFANVSTAADYDYTDQSGNVVEDITVVDANLDGIFTDTFKFVMGEGDTFEAFATANSSSISSFDEFKLFDASGTELAADYTETGDYARGSVVYSYAEAGLVAGDIYTLSLTATAVANGVEYSIDMSPVSAVPEPSTYALMLAGLGLVGFMARRRKAA